VYELNFYSMAKPIKVTVDDHILIDPKKDDIPFNTKISPNKGWWMPILEKALAKLNVNYANLA